MEIGLTHVLQTLFTRSPTITNKQGINSQMLVCILLWNIESFSSCPDDQRNMDACTMAVPFCEYGP